MNKRSSASARLFAVAALVAASVLMIVVIGAVLGGGDSGNSAGRRHSGQAAHRSAAAKHDVPATYTVESGDTLISIAHRNGVSVARIEALNPGVDPQILIAGETLKLR